MQLGNDIVDLKIDAEIHPRFLSRILHPDEKILYGENLDPCLTWSLWAAKEAAFKAHRQGKDPMGFLIPSRVFVDLKEGLVRMPSDEYFLDMVTTKDYVLATARSQKLDYEFEIYSGKKELTPRDQNREAKGLREKLGISFQPVKDQGDIPRMLVHGEAIGYSLSHHGRHIAIAVQKRVSF